ncbi:hypothetical protein LJ739_06080 [Aestuariibacter halophilus]|uniref:Uncharacterized protein n=1 Tax=Fluctibacter halophilus TaxID=226011 RepID=A0ABS8G6V1_9ALTE|nr:hypothetical protein [Aestuariibacter halophilus]MCC2615801.1 hypothetical protein [Aestuariibacter halophilus]
MSALQLLEALACDPSQRRNLSVPQQLAEAIEDAEQGKDKYWCIIFPSEPDDQEDDDKDDEDDSDKISLH